jgi:ribokinase
MDFIMKVPRLPKVGESVTNARFDQAFGGKGANQAVAVARSGSREGREVRLVASVGTDEYAEQMVESWSEAGLSVDSVIRAPGHTGTALIMIGEGGRNYITAAPGANESLTPARLDELAETIQSADYILTQFEIPEETVEHLIRMSAEASVPLIWNIAPMRVVRKDLAGRVDAVIVNETEAELLCGFEVAGTGGGKRAAAAIRELGTRAVIVTLGEEGSVVADEGGVVHVPAFPVEAVDTTAAGDTFCGCMLTALAEGLSLPEAVRFASAGAAISVSRLGAQPSIPCREEIDEFRSGRER